jgi:hypothetical protein
VNIQASSFDVDVQLIELMDKTLELKVTRSLVLKKVQKNKLKCRAKLIAKGWIKW